MEYSSENSFYTLIIMYLIIGISYLFYIINIYNPDNEEDFNNTDSIQEEFKVIETNANAEKVVESSIFEIYFNKFINLFKGNNPYNSSRKYIELTDNCIDRITTITDTSDKPEEISKPDIDHKEVLVRELVHKVIIMENDNNNLSEKNKELENIKNDLKESLVVKDNALTESIKRASEALNKEKNAIEKLKVFVETSEIQIDDIKKEANKLANSVDALENSSNLKDKLSKTSTKDKPFSSCSTS